MFHLSKSTHISIEGHVHFLHNTFFFIPPPSFVFHFCFAKVKKAQYNCTTQRENLRLAKAHRHFYLHAGGRAGASEAATFISQRRQAKPPSKQQGVNCSKLPGCKSTY
jgi:hypothetical protein